jgi:CheY-like chemotaxis protein
MSNPNWSVLVVEDDPDGQAVVSHILEYMNIRIDTASDAEEAAQLLFQQGRRYNAIIIDLALPGKDGWQLLAEVQKNPDTASIPCLAVTAYHTGKLREEAISAGFTAYFPKPLEATSFARELETLLR